MVATVIGLIYGGFWLFTSHNAYPASVYIEPGDAFYQVVVKLSDRNVIGYPWLFSKIGIVIGLDRHIIPGRYDFPPHSSNFSVIRKLWRGDIAFVGVTIPEGFTLRQISQRLAQKCGISPAAFDSLVRDSVFLAGLDIESGFAEGYLYPETYRFEWGVAPEKTIEVMIDHMQSHLTPEMLERAEEMGYSLHDLLVMASIIEAEGQNTAEYKTIASVYRNRLDLNMKLQADPTVIYGMGGLDRKLLIKDYQFPSTYNTYLHEGLPPTPICSPGPYAIAATLYPDSTDYLYFVADGNGSHVFNTNYRDHLRDTERIKKELKKRGL